MSEFESFETIWSFAETVDSGLAVRVGENRRGEDSGANALAGSSSRSSALEYNSALNICSISSVDKT